MYLTVALQSFGDRAWAFAVPVLFMDIWANTMLPIAIFAFVWSTSAMLLLPLVGGLVDTLPRLNLVKKSLVAQNSTQAQINACAQPAIIVLSLFFIFASSVRVRHGGC